MDLRAFSRKLDKHAAAVAVYYFIYKVNRVYPRSDLRTERFWRSTKLVEMCFGSGLPITASRFAPDTLRWAVVKFEKSPRDRIDSQATAKKMPADDIRMSNDELMLMISSLELVATILPAVDVEDSKVFSEKMAAVNRLTLRLARIAFKRGLRPISIASTNL